MSRKMRKNNAKKHFDNLFLLNGAWNKKGGFLASKTRATEL
jgi:hypothetical protein